MLEWMNRYVCVWAGWGVRTTVIEVRVVGLRGASYEPTPFQ